MLNKRIDRKVLNKILITLITTVTLFTSVFIFQQSKTIKELQSDLYYKEQVEDRKNNYTETIFYKDTIEKELNKLQDYKIMDGKVNIKHTYSLTEDSILGMKKRATLTATANACYQIDIRLSNAIIEETDKIITVTLDELFINPNVSREIDSFRIIDEETNLNLLCNKEIARKLQQYWEDSFVEKSYDTLKDFYSIDNEQKNIQDKAKIMVKELINTFITTNKKIIVQFTNEK